MSPRRRPRSPDSQDDGLPEAELEVLAALHALGEAEAAEVRRHLADYRPMTHASVGTLLRRLEDKGLVARRRGEVGKALLFRAVPAAEATRSRVVDRVLERVFAGDRLAVVASLFGDRPPSADEAEALRRLVASLEREEDEP